MIMIMIIRRLAFILSLSAVCAVGVTTPAAADITVGPCLSTGTGHCYVYRSQGDPYEPGAGGHGTLGNVSSASGWVRKDCHFNPQNAMIITAEVWLGTTPNTVSTNLEWIETGITSGAFDQDPNDQRFGIFFWARQYYQNGQGPFYNEYQVTSTVTAANGTNYVMSIQYVGGKWRIYKGSNNVGGEGVGGPNHAPGSFQWINAGAEASSGAGDKGQLSHLSDVNSGQTISGLTGDIFATSLSATDGFQYSTSGVTDISFHTPHSGAVFCQ
jgi:hypothetical protein